MIRILLIGCGDIALRAAELLRGRAQIRGLIRRADDVERLRTRGVTPLLGDLDDLRALSRLGVGPDAVLHCAPPPGEGRDDPRTQNLIAALAKARRIPQRLVYVSTSGVYGDCAGARIDETHPRRPQSPRAHRRVAAEDRLRHWAGAHGVSLAILRAPGIYSSTRLPVERIRQQTPVLSEEHDVYTNHIHADDLARACVAALFHGRPNRAYNITDNAEMKMGAWFDLVADAHSLPRPPRVDWDEAETRVAPMLLSFMSESRRLANLRMRNELRVRLRDPEPAALFAAAPSRVAARQMLLEL